MTTISLEIIRKRVEEQARHINVPTSSFPTYGYTEDFAHPHIEVDVFGLLHYIIIERGQEIDHKRTHNLDEFLYWIFLDITFSMSVSYELSHRIEELDFRRIMFEHQEHLMGILDKNWQQKGKEEHSRILTTYPFDDLAGIRATYSGQLRKNGLSEEEIDRLVYERFPRAA